MLGRCAPALHAQRLRACCFQLAVCAHQVQLAGVAVVVAMFDKAVGIVAQAQGDAQRFKSVLAEYQKAPQVTRDRMYLETMQQIYGNVTKVLVESRQGSNLLYLPLDKIMQGVSGNVPAADGSAAPSTQAPAPAAIPGLSNDARSRDSSRSRDREAR